MVTRRVNIESAKEDPEAWDALRDVVRMMCENGMKAGMNTAFKSLDESVNVAMGHLEAGVIELWMQEDEDGEEWGFRPGPNFETVVKQHRDRAYMLFPINLN